VSKRKKHEEHDNHERWLVSYADFITLLFAFFVVLYATSTRNESKEKEFQDSIRNYMKMMASGLGGTAGMTHPGGATSSLIESGEGVKVHFAENNQIEKELNRIIDSKMTADQRKSLIPNIETEPNGVRITLSSSSLFPAGSSKMNRDSTFALSAIAQILKIAPYRIVITGHTDDLPVQGKQFESNWELAGARASSVLRFLSKVHDVPERKMSAVSMADQRPLVENDTEENRQRNRRVEILISTREEAEE
jgi:chemotaxis protein MotB